jgi:predicted flap endonuclease-1-like 5' DNA nuclease
MRARFLFAIPLWLFTSIAWASNYSIDEIPGIIPKPEAVRLQAAGVGTTFALLEQGADPSARKRLAHKTKIGVRSIEGWVQLADLMRVKGIGPDVARLLTATGTKTIEQLKDADATKLSDQIAKVNSSQHLSQNPPSSDHLAAWIAQSQTLPIVVH